MKADDKRFKKYPFKGILQPPLRRRSSLGLVKEGTDDLRTMKKGDITFSRKH